MENEMFLRIIGIFMLLIVQSKQRELKSEQCELSTKHCSCEYNHSSLFVHCEMTANNSVDIETTLLQLENISLVQVEGGNLLPFLHRLNTSFNDVIVLDLSHSHQQVVVEKTTFKCCPKVEHIRLHDYNITSIEMGGFSYLHSLSVLDLSDNSFLSFTSIFKGLMNLQAPNLTTLNISGTHNAEDMPSVNVEHWMLKQLQNTHLEELDMSWTRLLLFQTSSLSVPYLKLLDISGTSVFGSIACLSTFINLRHIETFKLDHWPKLPRGQDSVNRLGEFSHLFKREEPSDCVQQTLYTNKGCAILPRSLRNMYIRFIDADSLYLRFKGEICFGTNHIHKKIIMSNMRIPDTIGSLRGLHQLQVLDLSNPDIVRPVPAFSAQFFFDMPSLEILLISGTGLHRIPFQNLSQLFSHNPVIEFIDISNNALEKLPPNLVINNTLLEVLNVSFNQLEVFTLDMSKNNHLKEIDLRYNNIRYFEENVLSTLSQFGRTLSLYLPAKKFDCDIWECKYEYLDLINVSLTCSKDAVTFLTHSNQSKPNVSVPSSCEPDISKDYQLHFGWIIGIASFVIIVLVLGVMAVWLYRHNKPENSKDITNINTNTIAFDNVFITISGDPANNNRKAKFVAFLSYSHSDTDFAIQRIYKPLNEKLKAKLPQHNPYSLIIVNDKNFLPGEPIDQLIEEAVSYSCVTIAVVSNDFANSTWCHFEVLTALTANIPIIPIYLKDCDPGLLKGSLNVIYNSRVRLMWPDTSELNCQSEEDKVIDVLVKSIMRHIPIQEEMSSSESTSLDGSSGILHRPPENNVRQPQDQNVNANNELSEELK